MHSHPKKFGGMLDDENVLILVVMEDALAHAAT